MMLLFVFVPIASFDFLSLVGFVFRLFLVLSASIAYSMSPMLLWELYCIGNVSTVRAACFFVRECVYRMCSIPGEGWISRVKHGG